MRLLVSDSLIRRREGRCGRRKGGSGLNTHASCVATWCPSGGAFAQAYFSVFPVCPSLNPVSFRSRSRQADIGFFCLLRSQPAETGNLVPPRSRAIDIRADALVVLAPVGNW